MWVKKQQLELGMGQWTNSTGSSQAKHEIDNLTGPASAQIFPLAIINPPLNKVYLQP